MKVARGGALVALVALAAACSGAEAPSLVARPSTSATKPPPEKLPYATPARWSVHPYPPSVAGAMLRLGSGGCVAVERMGQRWLVRPTPEKPSETMGFDPLAYGGDVDYEPPFVPKFACKGAGVAAVDRLPEPALNIVRWPGAYGFVGESGVVHVARWPLGPIVDRIPPPEPLVAIESTGGVLLAITRAGRVYRREPAKGYERVDIGALHAMDIVTAPGGRAAILAAPEALLTTEDAGRHFQRADAPSIGARRMAVSDSGRFLVEGVRSSLSWDPSQPVAFTPTSEILVERATDLSIEVGRYATAGSIAQGRGTLDDDTYWETAVNDYGDWSVFRGKIDGPLTEVPIDPKPDREAVMDMLLAARRSHVALVTTRWDAGRYILALRVSHDGAARFGPEIALELQGGARVELAVSLDGAVLLTNACIPSESAPTTDDEEVCPGGAVLVRPNGEVVAPRSSLGGGTARSPAFSPDGRYAYLLGEERYTRTSLYVSRDGGATFEERALETDGEERVTLAATAWTRLAVSESGTLGAAFTAEGDVTGPVYATMDAEGRELHVSEPPDRSAVLAGVGERAIAWTRGGGDASGTDLLAESTDGGRTWLDAPAPSTLYDLYGRGGDVYCSTAGCLFANDSVRVGWGAGRDARVPFDPPSTPEPERPLRSTIVCEPRPGSSWTPIEGLEGGPLPTEADLLRGGTAWMLIVVDEKTGEVSTMSASLPEKPGADPRVSTKRLLGPVPPKKGYAIAVRPQIEGVSLARIPMDVNGEDFQNALHGRRMRDLEVAWENLEEGTTGHARIDEGSFSRGAVFYTGKRYSQLRMASLSVTPGGIFVRSDGAAPATFFIDTKGKSRRLAYPDPPSDLLPGVSLVATDLVNVEGSFIAVADVRTPSGEEPEILFLQSPPPPNAKPDTPWTPWTAMLAPSGSYAGRRYTWSTWTYDAGRIAVWTMHAVPEALYATAWLRRVEKDGTLSAPRRVPTPYDLGASPRGCTAEERRTLPRLQFSLERWGRNEYPGVRHPILIRDPSEKAPPPETTEGDSEPDTSAPGPMTTVTSKPVFPPPATVPIGQRWLLTTGLVLRGDGATACLDGQMARSMFDWNTAAMISGDLSYGFLFRLVSPLPVKPKEPPPPGAPLSWPGDIPPTWPPRLEARPLTCRYDATATVPPAIYDANQRR